ncbi:MAG: rod shape-determining protein MreC [Frankiales bacterium]|nr:rod shape-determining protein MreC [Frankiales bacterium]
MRDNRRLRLTLVLLLLTAFTLTALDYNSARTGPLAALRRGIDTIFGPVTNAVGSGASAVGNALGGLPRLGSYQSENKKLKQENDRLRGVLAAQSGAQCQLDQFLALQHFTDVTKISPVSAKVVAVGASPQFEWTATLNVGSLDGIKPDMTVVQGVWLVGRTTQVQKRSSQVLLLADPDFTVGGTLVGQNTVGLASGRGSKPMTFSLPSTKLPVKKGTVLLTTGSDTYAPGVPIGTVTSVTPDTNAISRTATVVPFVDVTALDVVGVITQPPRTAPVQPLVPRAPGASPTSTPCAPAIPHGPVPTQTPYVSPAPKPVVTASPTTTPTP